MWKHNHSVKAADKINKSYGRQNIILNYYATNVTERLVFDMSQ